MHLYKFHSLSPQPLSLTFPHLPILHPPFKRVGDLFVDFGTFLVQFCPRRGCFVSMWVRLISSFSLSFWWRFSDSSLRLFMGIGTKSFFFWSTVAFYFLCFIVDLCQDLIFNLFVCFVVKETENIMISNKSNTCIRWKSRLSQKSKLNICFCFCSI